MLDMKLSKTVLVFIAQQVTQPDAAKLRRLPWRYMEKEL